MEDEDDFLASIGASVEDEDAALAEMGVSVEADGDLPGTAELPGDMRETGQRSRVTQLPAFRMAAGGGMVQDEGPAEVYEERTVEKAPSAHDVAPGTVVDVDRRTPHERTIEALAPSDGGVVAALTGRQGMTPASIRQAASQLRRRASELPTSAVLRDAASLAVPALRDGRGFDALGDAASVAMPTAPRPEGMSASAPDRRPEAAWRGIGGAALFGQADELGAALGGVRRPWLGEEEPTLYSGPQSAPDYTERRDALRQEAEQSAEQAPWGEAAGQLIGSAPLALLPGGQSTALGRVAAAGGTGAATGALRGAGESEAETPAGVLLDAGTGAAVEGTAGALVGGAGEGVSRLAQAARPGGAVSRMAAEARLEASGLLPNPLPRTTYGRELQRMGGAEGVAARLDEAGVGGRLPTPGDSAGAAERLEQAAGQAFDEVRQRMAGSDGVPLVDLVPRLWAIADEMAQMPHGPERAAAQRFRAQVIAPLEAQVREGVTSLPWEMAQRLRSSWGRSARFNSPMTTPAQRSAAEATQGAWGELTDAMGSAADELDPAIRQTWQGGNRRYQLAQLLATRARESGSRLPGAIAEAGAIVQGNPVGAVVARSAGGVISRYGPGIRARSLQALGATLRSLGGEGSRFGSVIEHARRTRGPAGAAAAHYLMMRTLPEYREAVERAEQAQEQAQ